MSKSFEGQTSSSSRGLDEDTDPIQLDIYGIKATVHPRRVDDLEAPDSWWQVVKRVHEDLKATVGGLFRLVRVTVESATDFIAGLGALPKRVTDRIGAIQHEASKREVASQEGLAGQMDLTTNKEMTIEKIRTLLQKKANDQCFAGLAVVEAADFLVLYILKPTAEDSLPSIVNHVVRALSATSGLVEHDTSLNSGVTVSAYQEYARVRDALNNRNSALAFELSVAPVFYLRGSTVFVGGNPRLAEALQDQNSRRDLTEAVREAIGETATWRLVEPGGTEGGIKSREPAG